MHIRLGFFLVVFVLAVGVCARGNDNNGYLENPPTYVETEVDFPLDIMSSEMPASGETLRSIDISSLDSDGFRADGENVQPDLDVEKTSYRLSFLRGLARDWAAGLSIPWTTSKIRGSIGGFPTSGRSSGFGDVSIFGKKQIGGRFVLTFGVEFPTGTDDDTFSQDNPATNGFYSSHPRRIPLSWQPGSGSVDFYAAAAYGWGGGRVSYDAILATKLHTRGDEDVKIGNIIITSANVSYGLTRRLVSALALTLRTQGDDHYPQAPPPGVDQPLLAGTTSHCTWLYATPSIRYRVSKWLRVGIGVSLPIVKPDDGLVPDTSISLIILPDI